MTFDKDQKATVGTPDLKSTAKTRFIYHTKKENNKDSFEKND